MGFHALKLWQNETFHCLNHMNIIIQTLNGKVKTNCRVDFVAEELATLQMK
jgi:hypothetical protein